MLERIVDEANAGQLPVLIEEWAGESDERRWLARALRLDLALLVERPELTVPCLLRRCVWFGEEYPSFVSRVAPRGAQAVRALARSWKWKAYLRSLRSPVVPLDAGVVEEYRTDATGDVWLTATHVGAGAVAWERASGRRLTVAAPPVSPSRWKIERNLVQLISPERAWPLPSDRMHLVAALGDDLALLTTSFWDDGDEYVSRTHGFDLRTGKVLFEREHDTTAVARAGDRLYLEHRGELRVVTLDGDQLARHRIVGAGPVFGPGGMFATRAGSVIRVWDSTQLALGRLEEAYQRGLVGISPDSTRAVIGQAVCDAHTGEELFQVDFHGLGNWLEVGPPENCRALCDDVIVEILPFGYRLWDSTTGEILVDDRNHRGLTRDAVAFAPNGRRHAILHEGLIRVFDNHTLAVVHESRTDITNGWHARLTFSADSTTLWSSDDGGPATAIQLSGTGRPEAVTTRSVQISGGVVTLDGLALPIDDAQAVLSADGKVVLGWGTHYVRD
ncbi:MAG: hypothetical protein ABI678_14035 [Kofleriaceae bacterium]